MSTRLSPRSLQVCAVVLVAVVFARGLGAGWIFDDEVLILGNPVLRAPASFGELVATPLWNGLPFWRPLTAVVLWAGHALGDGAPAVLHAFSLVLHLVAVAAAFALVRAWSGRDQLAFWAALSFGLHPVHVESVVWGSAINDVLWGTLGLLALGSFLRWRERGSRGIPWGATVAFLLALFSKEPAVALLPAIAVLDVARGRGGWRDGRWRAYGPMLVALLLYAALRVAVFGGVAAALFGEPPDVGADLARSISLRFELLGRFVGILCWPFTPEFFRPVAADPTWGELAGPVLAAIAPVAVFVVAWRRRWTTALLSSGLVLAVTAPCLIWLPSLGLYPVADRYLYLPAFGVALAAATAASRRRVLLPGLAIVAVAFAVVDVRRIGAYADQITFVERELASNPDDARLHYMHGQALLARYQVTHDGADLTSATGAFAAAERLLSRPRHARAAVEHLIGLETRIGSAWCTLAAELAGGRRPDGGRAAFAALVEAAPESANARVGLGAALASLGDLPGAARQFERAVELDPTGVPARQNLVRALQQLGREDEARAQMVELQRLQRR